MVLDTPLTEEMRTGFAAGVTLADGTALSPAEVTALAADGLTVRVVLRQGVYHQIKRMFGVYGAGVNGLHRDAIGGLALDPALAPVSYTHLDVYKRQVRGFGRHRAGHQREPGAHGCGAGPRGRGQVHCSRQRREP